MRGGTLTKLSDKTILINPKDNVATARAEIEAGMVLTREDGREIAARSRIPFGHKIALRDVPKGGPVIKYGEEIGRASGAIVVGDLVHVHNVESQRGRGR